ncbi:arginine deiminase family protein [Williamsoniiplasma somnilux]|uniref:arginine deiminase family protein n=1 Tax=Williamsoniiplasma somnilux TaxID=215578 RepID=UPI000462FF49
MSFVTRNRETLFTDFVFKHNSRFEGVTYFYERICKNAHVECKDILILNKETLIIEVSQRTNIKVIKKIAKRLFKEETYKKLFF